MKKELAGKVRHIPKVIRWITGLLLAFSLALWVLPLPDFREPAYATVLEAKDGRLLSARIAEDGQWRFPAADSLPHQFEEALLLFEDEYFYRHPGINPVSIFKALQQNIRAGSIKRGGSTLSMQLIRLARHNPPRTLSEKMLELLMALKLEMCYSKKEILNLYVSHAPFGGNVVGLSAAAWRYYGRPPEQLSRAEYAVLAVLPNSPSLVYPGKNSPLLLQKRNRLLDKLQTKGLIDEASCQLAKEEPLPGRPRPLPDGAPHLMNRLVQENGPGKIYRTSLETSFQAIVKEKVERHHLQMKDNHVYNAAAVVIEVKSGRALAYIGNVESEGRHGQYVDVVAARRSTGSLLKPILYAAALDEGLILPQQLLPDIPLFLQGFAPQNFDKKFHGAVAADQALARSYNIPFVHLLREYGYEKFHQRLHQIGIRSLSKPAGYYGLSMILGGAESSLWEISAAYAGMVRTLQNYPQRPLNKKYSSADYFPNNYLLTQEEPKATNAHSQKEGVLSAWSISRMLQAMQALNRPEEQAGWEAYESSSPIAWKTGTSYGFKDAWAIGMSSEYVVGVWLGNADGEGRPELTGVKAAAPLMFDIFRDLPKAKPFVSPYAAATMALCQRSGYKAGPDCESTFYTQVPEHVLRAESCPYHQLLQLDATMTYQVSSACYPTGKIQQKSWFVLPAAQAWYYKQYHAGYREPPEMLPACMESNSESSFMEFIYPRNFTRVYVPVELDGSPGAAVFEVAHRRPQAVLFWHLNGEYVGQTIGKHQLAIRPTKGSHQLSLVDEQGRELSLAFEVISERKAL